MAATGLVYSSEYLIHDTGMFHPESPLRLERALEALKGCGILDRDEVSIVKPRMATVSEMLRVHDRSYFYHVKAACERGLEWLDPDTPINKESFRVALLAAGGLLKGCEEVLAGNLSNAFALIRPPGHHAGVKGRALTAPTNGFCIFNNVAVAAKSLIEDRGFRRILILDVDCHHGNGTQEIFYGDPSVLFISLHQNGTTIYPGTGFPSEIGEGEGKGFNVNLPLPPGSGDDVYLKVFREIAEGLSMLFKPEFILVSAGFDTHKRDPVTYMNLTLSGYKSLYDSIVGLARSLCHGRLAVALEGGYGDFFGESVATAVASMAGLDPCAIELATESNAAIKRKVESLIEEVKGILRPYWTL
ncbi:MAG: histone deacetylase [Candidatus Bathyarchaeia archaeon]|nr:histone deacetylase [Candidatus Bathyarchaeota archaeon]